MDKNKCSICNTNIGKYAGNSKRLCPECAISRSKRRCQNISLNVINAEQVLSEIPKEASPSALIAE